MKPLAPGARLATALTTLLLVLAPATARAQDRYYLWIFSSQSEPKLPKYTHTFATFVHVADCNGQSIVDSFTISWMPATLNIRTFAVRPETGVNLTLPFTLQFVTSQKQYVSVWGPYAISCELYGRAVQRKLRLESGDMLYRAMDPFIRRSNISDCIHAVSDIAPGQTRISNIEPVFFGNAAGRRIAHSFRRLGLTAPVHEDLGWLEHLLGIDCYPMTRRR